jgi:hypothetical protein
MKPRLPGEDWVRLHKDLQFWGLLAWGLVLPGLCLLAGGMIEAAAARAMSPIDPWRVRLAASALFLGLALYCAGLGAYARHKGWHPAWGLLGLSCLLGLIVLRAMPKRCRQCERSNSGGSFDCPGCGAPV